MKHSVLFACVAVGLIFAGCRNRQEPPVPVVVQEAEPKDTAVLEFPHPKEKQLTAADISLTKELLYDQHTLEDTYPYKDTVRSFKWDVIRNCLAYIENMQRDTTARWVVLQNYKNLNKEAPLVRKFVRNVYRRVSDTLGVERYQSVPLYLPADTLVPERYGRDGTIAYLKGEEGSFYRILPATFEEEWLAPRSYLKQLPDSTVFNHVIFVDRLDQQKKTRMVFLKDGSAETGGYAPYASRFTNGAYIHGVPVNAPRTSMIEYSWSLGTTPRSHMCVRNATSHYKFVFDWAPTERSLVVVIE